MSFNPAGTVTLVPATTDVMFQPQVAGTTRVTPDSSLTLTSATITTATISAIDASGLPTKSGAKGTVYNDSGTLKVSS